MATNHQPTAYSLFYSHFCKAELNCRSARDAYMANNRDELPYTRHQLVYPTPTTQLPYHLPLRSEQPRPNYYDQQRERLILYVMSLTSAFEPLGLNL